MSLWKELYDIVASERSRLQSKDANKQAVLFELKSNLDFLADGLKNDIAANKLVLGLECQAFDQGITRGFSLNSLANRKASAKTVAGFAEFKKYIGKDSEYLINNAYLKIASLKKLVQADNKKDYSLKVKSLFRFLVFVVVHIEGSVLQAKKGK
ncbi:hypothetical protein SIN8267_03200 [Sinobacterium norvegicum]|uniref:Uncharacterized protein n=1 Tax=Sinobacterium norvegicum TaxID=1641715 RepID=A0ABN8EL22_9GAMM|nr:hypothetical protein [Sinobacterium norvegicum]CAH0993061.1 hypothetical protein SIN8267_03200 [Sinobacterium norvegicum]